jgi:chloramphenicol-sensitive protein RarD
VTPESPADAARRNTVGGLYAAAAYLMWGFLPLYFAALAPASAWEVVGWRIVFSLVFCALLILVTRSWGRIVAIARQPRLLALTALAGLLIFVNWQVFLIGTLSHHIIETSLGYFINPIVTVLLGVIVLRERLRPVQWAAIGLAVVAVGVIVAGYGEFPWIAVTLALSFGVYGLVKKRIGPSVDAVSGLTFESLWLVPIAVVELAIVSATSGLTIGTASVGHTLLLVSAGIVTAVPLLLFAAGTRRATLTLVGLLQFIAPILQFLTGWLLMGEQMTSQRWVGFGIVWLALAVLSVDSVVAGRRSRRARGASDVAELT